MTEPNLSRNYISNKDFTKSICEYLTACNEAEAVGQEIPVIPKIIAEQFIAMANKLGTRFNFVNYTFKDEMISNAIFACCAKIRKFNPEISQNAFAYFTNVCWRAFVDVINAEEKMSYIKAKTYQSIDYSEALDPEDISDFSEHAGTANDFIPYFDTAEYEAKMVAAKNRSTKPIIKKTTTETLEIE